MSEKETPVREIMSSPVQSISETATVPEVADIFVEKNIGSLIIGEDIVKGIVTKTDVVAAIRTDPDLADTPVSEIMSEPVVTIRPHEAVHVAGERMGHNNVKKLPVTEDGEPVGIVTTTDLAHFFPKSRIIMAAEPEDDVQEGEFE